MKPGELRQMTVGMWAEDAQLRTNDLVIFIEDLGPHHVMADSSNINIFLVLTSKGPDTVWADYFLQRSVRA